MRYGPTSQDIISIKDFGAAGDGVQDDSLGIANARAMVHARGGGTAFWPAGVYLTGNQPIYNNVYDVGEGPGVTTVRLKNGANTDLFAAFTGNINLSAPVGSGSANGATFFGWVNMTLDGNRANQTSGPSYPIRAYGYGHLLEHVEILQGYSGGVLMDWNASANPTPPHNALMPRWYDVMVHDCNGMLIEYGGPTDSQWIAVNGFASGSHCVHIAPNAVFLRMMHCHFWATPVGANAVTLLNEADGLMMVSCQIEGSDTCALVLLANDCQGYVLDIGSTNDALRQGRGIQLGQNAGTSGNNNLYAGQIFQAGGQTSAAAANVCHLAGKLYSCNGGAIDERNTQQNMYSFNVYQTGGTAIVGGYPSALSSGMISTHGMALDGSPGTGGIFQVANGSFNGLRVFDKNNNALFNIDTFDSVFAVNNGHLFSGYSDAGTTLKYSLNAADGSLLLGNSSSLRSGSGAPATALGANGDFYFRTDTPGTVNQRIYVKSAGAWVGIL